MKMVKLKIATLSADENHVGARYSPESSMQVWLAIKLTRKLGRLC